MTCQEDLYREWVGGWVVGWVKEKVGWLGRSLVGGYVGRWVGEIHCFFWLGLDGWVGGWVYLVVYVEVDD